jgi:putative transposase
LANRPRVKKPYKFLSLVYHQGGWRLSNAREAGLGRNKKRRTRLYLSKIGFFTLILHRVFPENQVCQVCVKLYPSGRIYVIFLVEEPEVEEEHSSGEPVEAVGVDLGLVRLATLSFGWALPREPETS